MKATELRIGNYVRAKSHEMSTFEEPVKVCITYLEMFCHNPQRVNFEPIPLTEKWLTNFGFKKWGRDDYPRTINYELGRMRIFPANDFCDFKGYGFMHYKPDKSPAESAEFKFQYVHQLQNLYFALTGEELTLKPQPHDND